jgi:hypothetical protein
MRRADLESIESIERDFELDGDQRAAFDAAHAKISTNIRRRETLYRLLGARNAERLIGLIRRG